MSNQHWSGSTVKVNSDGDYEEDEGTTTLLRRTKRVKQISEQSPASIETERMSHEQEVFQGKSDEGVDVIGSSKLEHAYNQMGKGNEEFQEHNNKETINTQEEIQDQVNTSKYDTEAVKAPQEVSIEDGLGRENKVTVQDKVLEAKINETRAASTTSFEYLLLPDNTALLPQIQSKEAGKGNASSFSGFMSQKTSSNEHISQQKDDTNVINQQQKGSCSKIDFDINVTLAADEDDANDHEANKHVIDNPIGNEDESWADYLDKARKKYFFYDDDTPTCHILEDMDDCGNEITEPELWRPVHMTTKEYNKKIENAKKIIVHQTLKEKESGNYHQEQEIKSCEFSVHCAQQQQSVGQRCTSPDGGIIDLTSPNTSIRNEWNEPHTCYSPRNRNTTYKTMTTRPPRTKHFFSEATMTGRILFPERANIECNLDGTEDNPITFLDHNSASPEVQILSQSPFKQSCSNLVDRSDEHYNTRLFLGSTSSSRGKENIPPKRVVQPSKFLCSPYDQDRGPIMEYELHLYHNILLLSENNYYKGDYWAIEIDKCRVSLEQLGNSFKPSGWVESYVINAYCRKLFRDNHPRTS